MAVLGMRVAFAGAANAPSGPGPVLWLHVRGGEAPWIRLDEAVLNGWILTAPSIEPLLIPGSAGRVWETALLPNLPNPFNPTTTITYDVPRGAVDVSIRIYDVTGALVRTLVQGPATVGR